MSEFDQDGTYEPDKDGLKFPKGTPKRPDGEWVSLNCTKKDFDQISLAVGMKMKDDITHEKPFGKLLAEICDDWVEDFKLD